MDRIPFCQNSEKYSKLIATKQMVNQRKATKIEWESVVMFLFTLAGSLSQYYRYSEEGTSHSSVDLASVSGRCSTNFIDKQLGLPLRIYLEPTWRSDASCLPLVCLTRNLLKVSRLHSSKHYKVKEQPRAAWIKRWHPWGILKSTKGLGEKARENSFGRLDD